MEEEQKDAELEDEMEAGDQSSSRVLSSYRVDHHNIPRSMNIHFKRGYTLSHMGMLYWARIPPSPPGVRA